jgi:hypothetical protein
MTVTVITKDAAKEAVRAGAFTIAEDYEDAGRVIVHCLSGFIGADWDLEAVLTEIDNAEEVAWTQHLLGHDLAVLSAPRDGQRMLYHFDVKQPS